MTVSMTELMRSLRNCFLSGAVEGAWRVEAGVLAGEPALRPGWLAAEGLGAFLLREDGTVLTAEGSLTGNSAADGSPAGHATGDGATPAKSLPDGPIEGPVWLLDPPADLLRLLEEINAWLAAQGQDAVTAGAVTRRRESFGAYSTETAYSTASGSSGSWEAAFAGRLLPYRRMFPEVRL